MFLVNSNMQDYPLTDIKVLDLSRVLAGPFAGRMLCDLGADVVKIEPPDQDVTRYWGHKVGSISGYYNQQNAGKRNVSIDLRKQEGIALVKDLATAADVLVENFRPGVMSRLGGDFRHIWRQLVDVHGMVDPTPEGAPLSEKIRLRREAVGQYLLQFSDRAALTAALDEANLAWGNVNSTAEYLATSPTVQHRNSVVHVDDRHGNVRPLIQSPYRFSGANSGIRGGAPFQGEHNQEVLSSWLGMNTSDINRLVEQQVLIHESAQD